LILNLSEGENLSIPTFCRSASPDENVGLACTERD